MLNLIEGDGNPRSESRMVHLRVKETRLHLVVKRGVHKKVLLPVLVEDADSVAVLGLCQIFIHDSQLSEQRSNVWSKKNSRT